MPAPSQTVFGFQSCRAVIRSRRVFRISMNLPLRSFSADVREPEEVERFWFAFP